MMRSKLPGVNKKNDTSLLSSQSVDRLHFPKISGANKQSKKGLISNQSVSRLGKSTKGNVHHRDEEVAMTSRKREGLKTNKVEVNPKKFSRAFSSMMASGLPDNPLRKVFTKNMLSPDTPAANRDIRTFWLYVVALSSRTAFLHCLVDSPSAFASPLAINAAKQRLAANSRLVVYIKTRSRWFRDKIKIKTDFVRNHGWKLILFWRCIKRRKAVKLLRQMLTDYESFRLPYVMLRYRVNAVHLQRYVRSFLEVTESRKQALLLKWHKIAAHMNAHLIPFLFEQRYKEEEERNRLAREKWQGVQIDDEVLPRLGARVNLATQRTAALQMQMHQTEAALQKRRDEIIERGKKSRRNRSSSESDSINRKEDAHRAAASVQGGKHNHRHSFGHHTHSSEDIRIITKIVLKFIYDCRRACKFAELHKVIVHENKMKSGMTCEEAKRILTNPFAAKLFAERLSSTEVRLEKIQLLIYTGQQDYVFRLLVENHLRSEHGLETKEDCTPYDLFQKQVKLTT